MLLLEHGRVCQLGCKVERVGFSRGRGRNRPEQEGAFNRGSAEHSQRLYLVQVGRGKGGTALEGLLGN